MGEKGNVLQDKSYLFALRMIKAYKYLTSAQREFVLSKQMLRSGTSIGAMVREAEYAQSKADFVNKLSISLKEANETIYWISLLRDSDYIDKSGAASLLDDCYELIKLLTSIIVTSKQQKQ